MLSIGVLLIAQLATPLGVVTAVKGEVEVLKPADAMLISGKNGVLLQANDAIETSENAWVEFITDSQTTVRLAAASQLTINKKFLLLGSGRIWIQTSGRSGQPLCELRVWGGRLILDHGSTVIAERVKGRGVNIFVARGEGRVIMKNAQTEEQVIPTGKSLWLKPSPQQAGPQKTSRAVWSLLENESRAVLGDRIGLERYLLGWIKASKPGGVHPRSAAQMPRMNSTIRGDVGSLFDSLLESAIRPAPFLENEVPPKGPNVRVEVTFEGP